MNRYFIQYYLLLSYILLGIYSYDTCDPIVFDASTNDYVLWREVSTTLICPVILNGTSVWHDDSKIIKIFFGSSVPMHLELPFFPYLANIKFYAFNETHRSSCSFSVIKSLITVTDKIISQNAPNQSHTIITYAPKKKERLLINGIFDSTSLKHLHYFINDELKLFELSKKTDFLYEIKSKADVAFIAGDRILYSVTTTLSTLQLYHEIKVAVNECDSAKIHGVRLCNQKCTDLPYSYHCSNDDYKKFACKNPLADFKKDWICSHEKPVHPISRADQKAQCYSQGINECLDSKAFGIDLCMKKTNEFPAICVDYPVGFTCLNGNLKLDKCNELKNAYNWTCPTLIDAFNLKLIDNSLESVMNNMETMLKTDPAKIKNYIGTDQIIEEIRLLNADEKNKVVTSLVALMNKLLAKPVDVQSEMLGDQFTIFNQVDKKKNVQSAMETVFKAFELTDNSTAKFMDEFQLQSGDSNSEVKYERTNLTFSRSDKKGNSKVIVAQFSQEKANSIWNMLVSKDRLLKNISSDVYIVKGEPETVVNLKYQPEPENAEKDALCQKFEFDEGRGYRLDDPKTCEMIRLDQNTLQCNCEIKSHRPFLIGIVFLLNNTVKATHNTYILTIINYVCISITISALILFLIFSFHYDDFRLDQVCIALCLLIFAIMISIAPHISPSNELVCKIFGGILNYSILAAFIWKLIFGLNSLLLVSCYKNGFDLVSKKRYYPIPILIGFGIPIAIIFLWYHNMSDITKLPTTDYQNKTILLNDLSYSYCIGPKSNRWPLLGTIFIVIVINLIILLIVGVTICKNCWMTRKIRLNKSPNLLVLLQLSLTLGMPFSMIGIQFFNETVLFLVKPISLAVTSVAILLIVTCGSERNRYTTISILCCDNHRKKSSTSRLIRSSNQYDPNLKYDYPFNCPVGITDNPHFDPSNFYNGNVSDQSYIQNRKGSITNEYLSRNSTYDSDYQSNSFGGRDSSNSRQIALDENVAYIPHSYATRGMPHTHKVEKMINDRGSILNSPSPINPMQNSRTIDPYEVKTNSLIDIQQHQSHQPKHFYPQNSMQIYDENNGLSSPLQGIMCSTLI